MKKLVLSIITVLLLSGCEKFLNVNPVNKAYESELFNDRSGFESALAGIYAGLNTEPMYGKDLKYGFLETMVGSYNSLSSSHYYYRSFRHEFGYQNPILASNNIWYASYQIINQGNIMMSHVDNLPKNLDYKLIKGEILGIRAFVHLQLLKLFGPVISQEGGGALAIPYRNKIDFKATKFGTADEVIQLIQTDLAEARALLEEDPIRTQPRSINQNQYAYEKYNSLIDNRGVRMNYYTILALQALTAQWGGDMPKARAFAEELIQELEGRTNSIHLATPAELASDLNKRMPMESLFSLLNQNLLTYNQSVNAPVEDTRSSSTSPLLFVNYNYLLNNLYNVAGQGSLNDYRLVNWFSRSANSQTVWKLVKYHFNSTYLFTNPSFKVYFENKILGLHQIYMVAAEEYADSNPQKAIDYLNKVRNSRNISTNIIYDANKTSQVIKDLVFDEIRKENIGEGMLISEYKRLFKPIHRSTAVQPKVEIFKLPIPTDEQLYNPQN
ncbi:RagB/SusD family nutrient uptake outer membrane protein [Sphingobacterium humi]|uniref:SusD-like N-terminal domain-containing protein n=1 Tax=Sphingobacterium humi TaxID=1796905 RepID=A0A6N8KXG8_9SPHI|nr:RagB/SusD family nutrient uptake outer membrane protein [Sphingobacterium humi]MVZ61777.1 hypothetical protein [Sphingobacterium humi]